MTTTKPQVSDAQVRLNYETRDDWSAVDVVFLNQGDVTCLMRDFGAPSVRDKKKYTYKVPRVYNCLLNTVQHVFSPSGFSPVLVVAVRNPHIDDILSVHKRVVVNGDLPYHLLLVESDERALEAIESQVREAKDQARLEEALKNTETIKATKGPLQLRVGGRYRTRDGESEFVILRALDKRSDDYHFEGRCVAGEDVGDGAYFTASGGYWADGNEDDNDLVEEV